MTLKTSSIGEQKVEKVYILSSVNADNSILEYMSDQLGTKTEFFDPFKQQTASPATESISLFERMLLSPALGFSLSDNRRTPNAIFTYQEKNREINTKRTDRLVISSFVAALIICLITLIYQSSERNILKNQQIKLEKELALYSPILSMDKISKIADEVKTQKKINHQYAQKYLGLAAIGEISDLTPQNINLISFKLTEGSVSLKVADDKKPKETSDGVTIEGVIFGDRNMLDSILAQYVMKLENSPVFSQVLIQKNSITTFNKNEVLQFTLSAKIG
jgi:hypothetical protein